MDTRDRSVLSIVIPVRNEAVAMRRLAIALAPLQAAGAEVIVSDGGSRDATLAQAGAFADRVLDAPAGRARQMNHGATLARGDYLWFLHVDSHLPKDAATQIVDALAGRPWGRFDVELLARGWAFAMIAGAMNRRSRWTGICTGDQGLFIRRMDFEALGGFPDQPLMEDVAFSARARRQLGWPACAPGPLGTSARRWQRDGVWRTTALMWWLRLRYWLGASPATLHRRYYRREAE